MNMADCSDSRSPNTHKVGNGIFGCFDVIYSDMIDRTAKDAFTEKNERCCISSCRNLSTTKRKGRINEPVDKMTTYAFKSYTLPRCLASGLFDEKGKPSFFDVILYPGRKLSAVFGQLWKDQRDQSRARAT